MTDNAKQAVLQRVRRDSNSDISTTALVGLLRSYETVVNHLI